jgi:hypothetical protein
MPVAQPGPWHRPPTRNRVGGRCHGDDSTPDAARAFDAYRPPTPACVRSPTGGLATGHAPPPGTARAPALADASPDPTKVTAPG